MSPCRAENRSTDYPNVLPPYYRTGQYTSDYSTESAISFSHAAQA